MELNFIRECERKRHFFSNIPFDSDSVIESLKVKWQEIPQEFKRNAWRGGRQVKEMIKREEVALRSFKVLAKGFLGNFEGLLGGAILIYLLPLPSHVVGKLAGVTPYPGQTL